MPGEVARASCQQIVATVAAHFHIEPGHLIGRGKRRNIAWPRHVAVWLCLLDGTRSSGMVGRYFNRDHSAMLHSRKFIEGRHGARRKAPCTKAEIVLRETACDLARALGIRRGVLRVVPVDN